MMLQKSTLMLPVENQVREFDAKLLLACVAAERGFPVVLGSRPYVNFAVPHLQRGVFVAKSLRARSVLMFNLIRDLGHAIVAWDEESLVRFQSPEYCPWRFSEATFRPINHLFAWGADDAELFSSYPGNRGVPVHVTGNPRTDLLRKELRGYFLPEADALRDRFGDFILINTNFSFVNSFVPKLNLVLRTGPLQRPALSRTGQGMSLDFAQGLSGHQQAILDSFRTLLPMLSAWFPDRAIVLRPHPSEDHSVWKAASSDLKNVHVIHEGNVVPWLMSCRVLLHNGCTTAVEAAVLGTPAIAYQPVTSGCFDYPLPNSLSHQAMTSEQVRELLAAVLERDLGPVDESRRRGVFDRHLQSTDGPLAADRVMDVVQKAGYGSGPPAWPGAARFAKGWFVSQMRTLIKHVNMRRRDHWNSAEYHSHRFPEIGADEIDRRIGRLRAQLGRFEGVQARQVSRFLFRVVGPETESVLERRLHAAAMN
ncbi:MAG: surface carbohydrate biosynthesis protein [Gammaproteobacteria bacterium]